MREPNWMDDVIVKLRSRTPEESRQSLIASGILNEDGTLNEKYRTSEAELAEIRRGPKILLAVGFDGWILANKRWKSSSILAFDDLIDASNYQIVLYPLELFEDDPDNLDPDFFEGVPSV